MRSRGISTQRRASKLPIRPGSRRALIDRLRLDSSSLGLFRSTHMLKLFTQRSGSKKGWRLPAQQEGNAYSEAALELEPRWLQMCRHLMLYSPRSEWRLLSKECLFRYNSSTVRKRGFGQCRFHNSSSLAIVRKNGFWTIEVLSMFFSCNCPEEGFCTIDVEYQFFIIHIKQINE